MYVPKMTARLCKTSGPAIQRNRSWNFTKSIFNVPKKLRKNLYLYVLNLSLSDFEFHNHIQWSYNNYPLHIKNTSIANKDNKLELSKLKYSYLETNSRWQCLLRQNTSVALYWRPRWETFCAAASLGSQTIGLATASRHSHPRPCCQPAPSSKAFLVVRW